MKLDDLLTGNLSPEETAELLDSLDMGVSSEEDLAAASRIRDNVLARIAKTPEKAIVPVRRSKMPLILSMAACVAVLCISGAVWYSRGQKPQIAPPEESSNDTTTTHTSAVTEISTDEQAAATTAANTTTADVPATQTTVSGGTLPQDTQTIPVQSSEPPRATSTRSQASTQPFVQTTTRELKPPTDTEPETPPQTVYPHTTHAQIETTVTQSPHYIVTTTTTRSWIHTGASSQHAGIDVPTDPDPSGEETTTTTTTTTLPPAYRPLVDLHEHILY